METREAMEGVWLSGLRDEDAGARLNYLVRAYADGARFLARGSDCDEGSFGKTAAAATRENIATAGVGLDPANHAAYIAENGTERIADEIALVFSGTLPLSENERKLLHVLGRALLAS